MLDSKLQKHGAAWYDTAQLMTVAARAVSLKPIEAKQDELPPEALAAGEHLRNQVPLDDQVGVVLVALRH
jgi:hypothetical protein